MNLRYSSEGKSEKAIIKTMAEYELLDIELCKH
jgi:hypothetical protein